MTDTTATTEKDLPAALPVGDVTPHSNGRLGFWGLIATEGALFGALLFGYFYSAFRVGRGWPPEGLPHLTLSGPNTILLILSSVTMWLGERSIKKVGKSSALLLWLTVTFLIGVVFLIIQVKEWGNKPFGFDDHTYASHFFIITGFHMAHVALGMVFIASAALWTGLGYFNRERHETISMIALYWHFVDAVWLSVFFSLYISPYLLR